MGHAVDFIWIALIGRRLSVNAISKSMGFVPVWVTHHTVPTLPSTATLHPWYQLAICSDRFWVSGWTDKGSWIRLAHFLYPRSPQRVGILADRGLRSFTAKAGLCASFQACSLQRKAFVWANYLIYEFWTENVQTGENRAKAASS